MKQIYIYIALIVSGICFGWYSHDYFGKPKEVVKEIITIDTVKVPPIVITKIQYHTKLPNDPDNPTTYKYLFNEDSVKFVVVIESEIEPMDVTVKDFFVQPKSIVRVDTVRYKVNEFVTVADSNVTAKLTIASVGSLSVGALLAKDKYAEAGIVGGVTFVTVYFYDSILNLWKWL